MIEDTIRAFRRAERTATWGSGEDAHRLAEALEAIQKRLDRIEARLDRQG